MELTFKRASINDIDTLVNARLGVWEAEEQNSSEDTQTMQRMRERAYSYYRRNLTDNEDVVYLAYDGSRVAGFGDVYFIHRRPLQNQNKKRAFISHLCTLPEYRGSGVDFKILQLLVAASLENEAEEITADDSESVREAYKKYGFRFVGDEWKLEQYA